MTLPSIPFIVPVALRDVIDRIGPRFERDGRCQLKLATMLNPQVPQHIADGAEWSVAASNPSHVRDVIERFRAVGPFVLGRTPLALGALGKGGGALGKGSEAPAGTLEGIAEVLRAAETIAFTTHGTSGATFRQLIETLGLADALEPKLRGLGGGEPIRALLTGEVDLAALPLTNLAPVRGIGVRAVCPWSLGVHIDLALCHHRDADERARQLVDWLLDTARDEELEAVGLYRAPDGFS